MVVLVLLAVCAPLAMALFLLLMERLEAALFPAAAAGQQETLRPELVAAPADDDAEGRGTAAA